MGETLRGKTAVITGSGSGIGRATAQALALEGVRVHVTDIDFERARLVAAEIAEKGGDAVAHRLDVSRPEEMNELAQKLFASGERVEILVNNAGICEAGPVEELSLDVWHRLFGVNLYGPVHGVRAFVPHMIERGGGHVVNVASLAGLVPFPFVAPYTASKHAVVALTAAMDMELSHKNVRVTAVCPGAVRTALYAASPMRLPGNSRERILELVERNAIGPEAIAGDIVRALKRRRALVIRAGIARPLWTLYRLAPRFSRWLTRTAFGWMLKSKGMRPVR